MREIVREDVKSYPVKFEDKKIKELITWYVKALQKAIDMIWEKHRMGI